MARTVTHIHLRTDDRITARQGAGDKPDYATIDVVDAVGAVVLHAFVDHNDLPKVIAELQAVVLALRDVVDDVIADEKANTPAEPDAPAYADGEPAWEMVEVGALTPGRIVWRSQVGQWQEVTGVEPWPFEVTLRFADGVATIAPGLAIRALKVPVWAGGAQVIVDAEAVAS